MLPDCIQTSCSGNKHGCCQVVYVFNLFLSYTFLGSITSSERERETKKKNNGNRTMTSGTPAEDSV